MFFVFPILLLSIYFPETNNFVLKKDSHDPNLTQNGKDLIFKDVQNDSFVFPTRKSVLHILQNFTKTKNINPGLNPFYKKLSENIPIKRHIQENDEDDISSMIKSTKSGITTSARGIKRKWPVVELLTHSEDLNENLQYFDDSEQKEIPFSHDIEKEFKVSESPHKYINSYVDLHNNRSKVKPVGLRSLPQRTFQGINCENGDQCECRIPGPPKTTTTPKTSTTRPPSSQSVEMGFPMGIPVGVPMGVPMGIPAGFAAGYPAGFPAGYPAGFPAGYPAGFPAGYPAGYPVGYPAPYPVAIPGDPVPCLSGLHTNYQPNIYKELPKHKKPSKTHSNDYLYYDDDDDYPEKIYSSDEDSIGKKRKHEKQHKAGILFDVKYDISELNDQKPTQNPKCRNDHEDFAGTFNERKYIDTLIKDCYYSAASSCAINFRIVFLMFMIVTFC